MTAYRFRKGSFSPDSPAWAMVVAQAYTDKEHPACLCRSSGAAPTMYIARHQETHIIKRMPFSGCKHAAHCDHYEPPPELSGLGQVAGAAIREDDERDITTLNLDFALTKGAPRAAPVASDTEHESVRSDGTKLTLRATLHYLYDQAALTRWTPKMRGKRSWGVVRRELINAAANKMTKGKFLNEALYIPETFNSSGVDAMAARRNTHLAPLAASASTRMIVIAPYKVLEHARFGYKLLLKHMPDMALQVSEDLHKRMQKNFSDQLALWSNFEQSHMLVIGTISRQQTGLFNLESVCLINVTENWIPFDSSGEYALLHELTAQDRQFTKGLRYNLPSSKPLASIVLQDSVGDPTAMYLIPTAAASEYERAARELAASSDLKSWWWRAGAESMPMLPAKQAPTGKHGTAGAVTSVSAHVPTA